MFVKLSSLAALSVGIALMASPRHIFEQGWSTVMAGFSRTDRVTSWSALTLVSAVGGIMVEREDIPEEEVDVRLKTTLDYPKRVTAGDSFVLRAKFEVTDIKSRPSHGKKGRNLGAWQTISSRTVDLQDYISGFSLALAGTNVKPEGTNIVIKGTSTWSVQPSAPGRLVGVLVPVPAESSVTFSGDFMPSVSIEAYENPFAVTRGLAWLPKLLGTLLTVPGIVAFVREYRQRKEAATKKREQDRRVVLP